MSDYFDVGQFKKTKSDRVIFIRLGSAKKREDGGFNVYLDAIPASTDGQYSFSIVPPREKKEPAEREPF
jgi:hypothetical protein